MTDQEYREIQLSGKQIVFLFMSLVVVAVVIFLLGVSVGRGVRSPGAETAQGAVPTDTVATVATPPPTQTAPGDLKYHSMLQGQPGQSGGSATPPAEPPPPSSPPAQTDPVPTEPQPPAGGSPPASGRAAATPEPATGASVRGTPPPPVATPPPPKTGGWMVQVGAFRSRGNADTLVAQLKKKGHPATIVNNAAVPNAPFHVRVGPYADKAEADRAAAVLAKEQGVGKPSVIPR